MPRPSLASDKGSRPRRISVSPEAPLQRRTHLRLTRGPAFAKKQPLTKSPHRPTESQEHLTQRWPDTFILTHAGRAEVTAVTSPLH
jgi:hypothetical protein